MNNHAITPSGATTVLTTPRENSVKQARWILMPLFGLWIMFSLVGVIFA
jgi:hypothetical protein